MNIPLVKALEKMLGYTKLLKFLVTKKRKVSFMPANNMHHCITISSLSFVIMKKDSRVFKIPYTTGS